MGVRVPQNQIIESKYTSGNEYMFAKTYKEYKGYYYEMSGKQFAGKEFNVNNPEIIKIDNKSNNKLKFNPLTYVYGAISGVNLVSSTVSSIPNSNNSSTNAGIENIVKFYCKKINQQPIIIKEISEDTYKSLQSDPLYQTTYVGVYQNRNQTPDDAEKKIPGIKAFLGL